MTEDTKSPKKVPTPPLQAKNPFVGMPPRNPAHQQSGFNNFGSKGKGKGGPQVLRKHAARSR